MGVRRQIRKIRQTWQARGIYRSNRSEFLKRLNESGRGDFRVGRDLPCLADRFQSGGTSKGAYFFQDLIVARKIFERRPASHVDVGSRVDGFVAHVAVFMPVDVYDIRPVTCSDPNIRFQQIDIMREDAHLAQRIESLSCLHALEHFGLGRYGDPIDIDGHLKGFAALVRALAPGGTFYFSVPISRTQRIEFDAHRIFCLPYLKRLFAEHGLAVRGFDYVDDRGELVSPAAIDAPEAQDTFGLRHGCGIFDLVKK